MSSILDVLSNYMEAEKEHAKRLPYDRFLKDWLELLESRPEKFEEDISVCEYGNGVTRTLCPEPLTFIKEFDDFSDDQNRCLLHFESRLKDFKVFPVNEQPEGGKWFNTTLKGINLRPGLLNEEKSSPLAVKMGDQNVHGVIVGRTGSGKSVFINNLLLNLLAEYPPWELDLYLADFKKVELSRYMNKFITPHVNACAATSEIRYVVSLFSYLVDIMYARQTFFARLGFQKIEDFRKAYPNLVLPRVLFVVDEFQQLFLEATPKESMIINELLLSIVKLGRATGFHLLFASQEMSGALSAKALANFKIRFALPCEGEISSAILGNSAAENLDIGEVLVNVKSGKEEQNQRFKVPVIVSGDQGQLDLYDYLGKYYAIASGYSFSKVHKFYQEEVRDEIGNLELSLDAAYNKKDEIIRTSSGRYTEIITLGESVVYSNRKVDLETFFIERGKNKNIISVTPNIDDFVYIQKMLAINFKKSTKAENTSHTLISLNSIARNKYKIEQDLENTTVIESFDGYKKIMNLYYRTISVCEAYKTSNTFPDFLVNYFREFSKYTKIDWEGFAQEALKEFGSISTIEDIELKIEEFSGKPKLRILVWISNYYCLFKRNPNENIQQLLDTNIFWFSGIENIERIPSELLNVMKNATEWNMLFIFFATTDDNNLRQYLSYSDYIFVSGNYPKIYEKCGLNFTNKSRDSIALDFKIKSLNTERSFKKYKVEFAESIAPSLNYDEIMGG
ncbi:FtsK/SpoIIIE domain-containing protein [Sporosarcina sp. FA9]|uniref:FtsK/SpoIIIE domain-containing protein n=1 Tax=Sporosarcina sp. FA9 TaxID=3413030 RepID=UPI003F65A4BD